MTDEHHMMKPEQRALLQGVLERMAREKEDILRRVAQIDQDIADLKRLDAKYP